MANPFTDENPEVNIQETPFLEIAIGVVGEEGVGNNALYSLRTDDLSIFNDYMVVNRYEKDFHRYMMGIASPDGFQGSKAAFVQLASPTLLWIAQWTAMRTGGKPPIPDPELDDPNWVLLDVLPETAMMNMKPDGVTPVWRISGVYVYGQKNPDEQFVRDLAWPRPPWADPSAFDRSVPVELLTPGLITEEG